MPSNGSSSTSSEGPRPTTSEGPRPTTSEGPRPTKSEGPRPTKSDRPAPTKSDRPAPTNRKRRTIVFLHGTRLTGAEWAVQVASLSDEFDCLTPDLPGHGDAADVGFSVEVAAERIAALIDREATDGRAILVGLSLGGYVAMAVAARWPKRVAGLAIAGATAEPVGPRTILYRGLAAIFTMVPERTLDAVNRWFFGWRYAAEIADPILAEGFFFEGGAAAVLSLIGERFKPRLAAYPGPSLLLNGEFDLVFRPTERSFADVAANPRRALIRRATHLSNLDQPATFTAAIRRFARSLPG
jgi:pimeloyl-ACP methyl ester carboxylesterase